MSTTKKASKTTDRKPSTTIEKEKVALHTEVEALRQQKKQFKKISQSFQESGFADFVRYIKSPWRIVWMNFISGVFKGVGIIVGATVVIALIIWLLGFFVDFPLIGDYISDLKTTLESYTAPGQ